MNLKNRFSPTRFVQDLKYYSLFGFLYAISLFPFWLWYRVSDGLYLLLFYGVKYRRKVVWKNISTSFPERSEAELQGIMKEFYRHICDVLVETIKAMSMSEGVLKKRVIIENQAIWDEFIGLKGGALLLAGHYGNFELWGSRMDIMAAGVKQGFCVYTPQKSQTINRLIHYSRARRGGRLIARRNYVRKVRNFRNKDEFIVVLADQAPQKSQKAYFTRFLGKATAFFTSTARYALEMELPVYFAEVKKLKRGHYSLKFHKLPTDNFLPLSEENVHAYTDLQVSFLEKMIRHNPAYWLWSHKRWKRGPEERDSLSPSLSNA